MELPFLGLLWHELGGILMLFKRWQEIDKVDQDLGDGDGDGDRIYKN